MCTSGTTWNSISSNSSSVRKLFQGGFGLPDFFACHPQRSGGFASRNSRAVEGPLFSEPPVVLFPSFAQQESRYRKSLVRIGVLRLVGIVRKRTILLSQDDIFQRVTRDRQRSRR